MTHGQKAAKTAMVTIPVTIAAHEERTFPLLLSDAIAGTIGALRASSVYVRQTGHASCCPASRITTECATCVTTGSSQPVPRPERTRQL